jgi:hypothetical protein
MLIRDVIRDREPYSMKATASVMEASEFMAQHTEGSRQEAGSRKLPPISDRRMRNG